MDAVVGNSTLPNSLESHEQDTTGKVVATTVNMAIEIIGFISNCIMFDLVYRERKPSTSMMWTKFFVCWCNLNLAINLPLEVLELFGIDIDRLSRFACKAVSLSTSFTFYTAVCHGVAIFCDQALATSFPTQHYQTGVAKVHGVFLSRHFHRILWKNLVIDIFNLTAYE